MKLQTDINYIKESLVKNDNQHKEIIQKIDHLFRTFQGKIQDKADQKEVIGKFDSLDSQYASKDIEKWAYGGVASLILILLGIIGYLLDKIMWK